MKSDPAREFNKVVRNIFRKTGAALRMIARGEWGELLGKLGRRISPLVTPLVELGRLLGDVVLHFLRRRGSSSLDLPLANLEITPGLRGAEQGGPKNLVWIMLDALREDIFREHLRRGGFGSLEPKGYFTRAFVQGSWTYPSVFSFLTGRYPFNCGVSRIEFENGAPLSHCSDFNDAVPTIFDILRDQGYQVGSILDGWGFTVRTTAGQSHREDRYFEDQWGWFYGQGERFLSLEDQRRASVSFLEQHAGRSPFMLFVRSLYTHSPYRDIFPSPEYVNFLSQRGWKFRLVEGFLRGLRRFEEEYLQALLETLERADMLQDTIVVLCSDHGEMLWDLERDLRHAKTADDEEKWRHQLEPYNALIHVPLLLSGTRIQGSHDGRFRLIDLVPTLLDEMGVAYDPGSFDGSSLWQDAPRPIYADSAGYGYGGVAFQDGGAKLLSSSRLGAKAYPIEPGEFERLSSRQTATLEIEDFRQFLSEQQREQAKIPDEDPHQEILQRRLRDLGYID